ncbi:MAG: hypothetical protein JW878_04230 [Methanomicrobia archaeon]|nr:hypothetical protein [Methanomicrobia archaeon]
MTGNYTPPAYWSSPYGRFRNQVAVYTDPESTFKNTTYEVGAWMEPNWGTINFPFATLLQVNYKIFYTDKRVEWDFWNGYKYTRMNKTDTSTSELDVLYFDVLPESIDDFAKWREITSQDHDGDGLTNGEDSCPWSWDCDGDGLSDNYELLTGTDPENSDMDRDGLNDRMEVIYGTDPLSWDTDGDNLSDYKEINGWVIDFDYGNQTFNMSVRSDPLMPDTDGDGVDDQMEYWSILNPRSKDSDGDGVLDVADPKYITYVRFEKEWGSYGTGDGEFKEPNGIAVDHTGYVYVADTFNDRIQKFDSNGTFLTKWGTSGLGNGSFYYPWGLAVDANGSVYVIDISERIQVFDSNGTFITSWNGTSYDFHTDIAVANGHIYVPGVAYINNSTFKCIHKIDSNGTPITHWSIETLTGVTALAAGSGYVYVTDGFDAPNTGLYQFDSNGTYINKWGSEGYNVSIKPFSWPRGLAVDSRGFVYIADSGNHHIQKFASDGFFITRWGQLGSDQGNFTDPSGIAVDSKNYVYVTDGSWDDWYRVQKFSQITELPPRNVTNTTDTDGDGLTDINETTGWNVTFINVTGTFTLHATSEPLANDTDFDGLTDYGEFNHSSNPRDVDTDDDRLTDFIEYLLGTNITHYDTDGDGLDDGTEIIFGSDPTQNDSDNDGLSDYEEFKYLSDPKNNDTDGDGLNDLLEKEFNSSLLSPDSDGDLMFDGLEYNLSTNPWNPDSDGDELPDGYEVFFNTSPSINDSDSDGVLDGTEVDRRMNPLCNDTDGDGLPDGKELDLGTDPLNEDSDGDGIPDSEDFDSFTTFEEPVFLAYDPDPDSDEFVEKLNASLYNKSLNYTYLHIVSLDELLNNHADAPYIVLVGRPDAENGTIGSLIHDLLADSGDVLDQMLESDYDRFAVRYGLWNNTQTVVMLSHPYPSDHYSVLNILKGMRVTIRPDSAKVVYPAPRDFFEVNTIDTLKETDSVITVGLDETVTPWISMSRHNTFTTPFALTHVSGLARDEVAVGKYLEIQLSENVQNETGDIITGTLVKLYYTVSDLDRTGDGDADDAGDIDERTLQLYWFDESRDQWTKLSEDLEGVVGTGVDTSNVELYGKSYEGYVWANVAHSSTYGLAGETKASSVIRRRGGSISRDSDGDGWSDVEEMIKGTDPNNPDTDGDGLIDSEDPYPLDPTRPVQPAVTPSPEQPLSATPLTIPPITPAPTPVQTPVARPTPEEPGFEAILWLLAVAFSVIIVYLSGFKRRKV